MALLSPRIDLPGDRDRLLAQGSRLRVAIEEHQDLAEARERACTFGRRPVGRGDRDGLAVGLEGAGHVAEHPQATSELLVQDPCTKRVGDPVDAAVGFLAMRDGAPVVGRQVRRLARLAQQLDPVEAGHASGSSTSSQRSSARSYSMQRRTEGVRPHCRLGGAEGRRESSVVLSGGGPVVRQLGPAARFGSAADGRSRVERLGEGPMQGAPLAGQQVVVHDLLDERVAERIALDAFAGFDDEQMAADRGAEPVEQLVLGQARRPRRATRARRGGRRPRPRAGPPSRSRVSPQCGPGGSRGASAGGAGRLDPGGSRPAAPRRRTGCRRIG